MEKACLWFIADGIPEMPAQTIQIVWSLVSGGPGLANLEETVGDLWVIYGIRIFRVILIYYQMWLPK